MRRNKKYLLLLVIFLGIGFAYLSTVLNIFGTGNVKGNNWDIHFENVQVLPGSVDIEKPQINSDGDTVNYTAAFEDPDDYLEFTVDVKNEGTLNGEISSFVKSILDEEMEEYIDYTITYQDGSEISVGDLLEKDKKKTILVHIGYNKDNLLETDIPSLDLSFTINYRYTQKTSNN